MNTHHHLTLRLFATCPDAPTAARLLAALLDESAAWMPWVLEAPLVYWKMPELYEFYLAFFKSAYADYQSLLRLTTSGWCHGGDENCLWSVWNRQGQNLLLLPEAVWAEIQWTAPR